MDGSKAREMPAGMASRHGLHRPWGALCRGGGRGKPDCVGLEEMEAAQIDSPLG